MRTKDNKEFEEFKAGRDLPFSVPEGYFDSLPNRIQDRIQASMPMSEPHRSNGFAALRSQLAFAAGFAFMAVIAYFAYFMARPLAQKKVSNKDYVEIVSRNISDFDDMDLYQAIEKKRKQDTVDKATCEMYKRYYVRSSNCISIIDEKKEVQP